MIALLALIAAGALLGYVTRRTWSVAVAVAAIVGYYLGLDDGLWGNGTGDAWQFAMLLVAALAAAAALAGVVAGRR